MNDHRILALAALTTFGLVAAACGGSEEATEPPTATATTATAPSENPTPTVAPTVAPTAAATPVRTTPAPVATPVVTESAVDTSAASSPIGVPEPAPKLVDLVLPDGSPFELASLQGENLLLFFGYTHCPDVCPQTLGEIFGVFEALPETQAVFVSVDPERDTPEFLEEWTAYLPDSLQAVTGSPGAIRRAADNYGVKYARVETTSTAGYTMSHTADIYLIDADGRYLLAYPFGTLAAEVVEDLEILNAS